MNMIKQQIKSWKKYTLFIFSSLSSSLIDLMIFHYVCIFLENRINTPILVSTIIARFFSCTYYYLFNYYVVFKAKDKISSSACKYLVVSIIHTALSALFVSIFVKLCPVIEKIFIKAIVEIVLFFINYVMLNKIVFKKKA